MIIGGELHRDARNLLDAIDALAQRLTGRRNHFWDAAPKA